MLSYVYSAATSYVRYPSFAHPAPPASTDVSRCQHHSSGPSFASTSASPSSSRESSRWDSSSDASDASTASSSSRHSTQASSTSSRRGAYDDNDDDKTTTDRYSIIHDVLKCEDLYDILGSTKTADLSQLRRAYITRSKRCHPDKFPDYPLATLAFQKLSFAYYTLSQPSGRRAYDKACASPAPRDEQQAHHYHPAPDDTLNAVLYGVFCDFMDGDFEMIRTFMRAMGEINSRMQMGEETIESLLASLMRLRELLLAGRKYIHIVRFQLIQMYEIQSNLRALSYFNVRGRLRLTLQLARVTLSLPVVVDLAMREEDSNDSSDGDSDAEDTSRAHQQTKRKRSSRGLDNGPERPRVKLGKVSGRRKRGLLPPPVSVVIGLAIGALEIGERVL